MNDNPISTTGAITLVTTLLNNPNCPLQTLGLEVSIKYKYTIQVKRRSVTVKL